MAGPFTPSPTSTTTTNTTSSTFTDYESFDEEEKSQFCRRITFVVLAAVCLIFLAVLNLMVFAFHPSRPAFVLKGATVHEFNATSSSLDSSSPNFVSMNMEAALSSLNPSAVAVRYSQLRAYASYRGKQITLPAQLPESYQRHKGVTDWSPVLKGNTVLLTPDLGSALAQDLNTGSIPINVKVDGLVKWKPSLYLWPSKYHLYVNCPTVMMPKASGIEVQQLAQHCLVKVKIIIF